MFAVRNQIHHWAGPFFHGIPSFYQVISDTVSGSGNYVCHPGLESQLSGGAIYNG